MKRISSSFVIFSVILAGLSGLSNMSFMATPEVQRTAPANYQKFCAGCHGANLEKFAAKKWMDEEGTSTAFRSIKYGIEDIGMPSFQKTFTDSEIEALAAYVKKGIPEDRSKLQPARTEATISVLSWLLTAKVICSSEMVNEVSILIFHRNSITVMAKYIG